MAPKPTTVPARAVLVVAPIPPPPPGLSTKETRKWRNIHLFLNLIDAIENHVRPPGQKVVHPNTLVALYFNAHVAGTDLGGAVQSRYTEPSLFSRRSNDRAAEQNLHLATIGFPGSGDRLVRRRFWNWYLSSHGLPEVEVVGTGLPDALRDRNGSEVMAAAALISILRAQTMAMLATSEGPQAAAGSVPASQVSDITTAETADASAVVTGEAGRRRARVESAIFAVTEETDQNFFLALRFRLNLLPLRVEERNEEAIIRLAGQFLRMEPRATPRAAVLALARAGWVLETAVDSWEPTDGGGDGDGDSDGDGNGNEDEGQPPSKRRRLDDGDNDGESGDGGPGEGKGKGKERAD